MQAAVLEGGGQHVWVTVCQEKQGVGPVELIQQQEAGGGIDLEGLGKPLRVLGTSMTSSDLWS